jgi:hydrogenase nickel incorporation protein HypA/HybF
VHGVVVDVRELSSADAILDAAVRSAEGQRMTEVRPSVGALCQIVPQTLAFDFALVAKDTLCDGAFASARDPGALALPRLSDRARDRASRVSSPACDSAGGEVVAGDELEIESIVLEEQLSCTEGS